MLEVESERCATTLARNTSRLLVYDTSSAHKIARAVGLAASDDNPPKIGHQPCFWAKNHLHSNQPTAESTTFVISHAKITLTI